MLDGKYRGTIETYSRENKLYLNAQRAIKSLGGKLYWYPISGRLVLHINRIRENLYLKSDDVIVRAGKVFVSMDFFTSKRFADILERDLSYNRTTHILQVGKQSNVVRLNYFAYKDKTRVVVTMKKALEYHLGRKSAKRLDIVIPNGIVESADKVKIGDGVVDKIVLAQKRKRVKLSLSLGKKAVKWNIFRLREPDRIVIDVFSSSAPQIVSVTRPANNAGPVTAPASQVPYIMPEAQTAPSAFGEGPAAGWKQAPEQASASFGALQTLEHAKKRIVLDPGHGGKDPGGRRAFGLAEKIINLLVAKQLVKLLEEDDIFDVLLTRTSDVFMTLEARSRIANDFKADVFISLHANASRSKKYNGFEVYFMSENASDPWAAEVAAFENAVMELEDKIVDEPALILLRSMARNEYINEASVLAARIVKQMAKRTPMKNRGIKRAAFFVLRGTYSPAVLIEMGFMTNSKDQANLGSRRVRGKIASGIYAGIIDYAKAKGWQQ